MNIWERERAEIFVMPDKDDTSKTQTILYTHTHTHLFKLINIFQTLSFSIKYVSF